MKKKNCTQKCRIATMSCAIYAHPTKLVKYINKTKDKRCELSMSIGRVYRKAMENRKNTLQNINLQGIFRESNRTKPTERKTCIPISKRKTEKKNVLATRITGYTYNNGHEFQWHKKKERKNKTTKEKPKER